MAITLSTTTPKNESGHTSSLWMEASWLSNNWPTLTSDAQADVCVVGAGIAGLTTAYLLSLEGKSVIVLEGGQIAQGESARTTAQLVNALDNRYFRLEELHGASGARLAAESHTAAIDRIEAIVSKENISCDFERLDGYLFASTEETTDVLDKELDAAHRCGLKDIAFAPRAPLVSGFDTGRCLRFPRQAQFQPLLYLEALAQAVKRNGGRIFTQTQVKEFKGGSPNEVITGNGLKVSANDLVVATNTPVNDWVTMHTKQAAYRSYVVGMRVPKGAITKALYWDTADPFHYVRLQSAAHHDVLIVGGEDHKTGQAEDTDARFDRLEAWARARFPMAAETEYRWSGQVMETNDGLAFIGRNPGERNVYIVTGDCGTGMTHGTIAGMVLTDQIMGRKNEWESLYDPSRISPSAAAEFAKENLNVLAQFSDYVTGGDVDSLNEIARGNGAILRRGLKKVAAYRDTEGTVHELSAVWKALSRRSVQISQATSYRIVTSILVPGCV